MPLLHVADGERVVLVASNWGRRNHPAWSLNLEARPDATLAVDGVVRSMRARPATDAERQRYWAEAVRVWPGYEGYRRRAGRKIRLYVLEPRAEPPSDVPRAPDARRASGSQTAAGGRRICGPSSTPGRGESRFAGGR